MFLDVSSPPLLTSGCSLSLEWPGTKTSPVRVSADATIMQRLDGTFSPVPPHHTTHAAVSKTFYIPRGKSMLFSTHIPFFSTPPTSWRLAGLSTRSKRPSLTGSSSPLPSGYRFISNPVKRNCTTHPRDTYVAALRLAVTAHRAYPVPRLVQGETNGVHLAGHGLTRITALLSFFS